MAQKAKRGQEGKSPVAKDQGMPNVRSPASVLALAIGDTHFSEQPPLMRCMEDNWLATQEYYIDQLRNLQIQHRGAPILIAGDLFNHWDASAHLINQVLRWLRGLSVYAINGNHDTPWHSNKYLGRSAYWTLVEAGVVKHLAFNKNPHNIGFIRVHAFPFGRDDVHPLKDLGNGLPLEIALVHQYVYTKDMGYPGADPKQLVGPWSKKASGYDTVIIGDNHQAWDRVNREGKSHTYISNCGTFMRRRSNEQYFRPSVILVHSDGSVDRHYLDVSEDKLLPPEVAAITSTTEFNLDEVVNTLLAEQDGAHLDYEEMVRRTLSTLNVSKGVRRIVLQCLEKKAGGDERTLK